MKKLIYLSALLLSIPNTVFAAVTISGGLVTGQEDASGVAINTGRLYLVVFDTAGDGFGDILDLTNISLHSSIDTAGNDIILKIESTFNAGPSGVASQGSTTSNYNADSLNLSPTNSRQVAVYWFPELAGSTTTLTLGDSYGIARNPDWILNDPNDSPNFTNVTAAGPAMFTVVPEPTSTALLGLGGLTLLMRRRRA